MSDEIFSKEVDEKIGQVFNIEELGGGDVPLYRMVGASKIPISEKEGKLWKDRYNLASKNMDDYKDEWNRNIDIYNNLIPIDKENKTIQNKKRLNSTGNAYENLVWSNTVGLIPELFAQNPKVSITNLVKNDTITEEFASLLQTLIDAIINKKSSSGVQLKSKAKKSILYGLLTNRGIIKLGWVNKLDSNETALKELYDLAEKLKNAKDEKEIKELEGKLISLDETIDLTSPSGPFLKVISPVNLYVDPTSYNEDGSDANWMIERDWMPTDYLIAKYGRKSVDGEIKSVYSPSDNLPIKSSEIEGKLESISSNGDATKTVDENIAKHSNCTEVFWVYDKIKRRILLYSGSNWNIPLWTWDDPLKLDTFFPYYVLNFYTNPKDSLADGEVNYYISIQNEINAINNEKSKIRSRAFNSGIYNSKIVTKDVLAKLNSGASGFIGIDLPADTDLTKVVQPMPTPSMNLPQIFDKSDLYSVMNKIASADAVTRGEEFKTNTTNLAIGQYEQSKGTKVGEKRDIIEEWIGNICWGILQLALQHFNADDVARYVGAEKAAKWPAQPMSPDDIDKAFSLQVVGETTVKPTSSVKKQQALQISQVLGQFASASPSVVIVMLTVLQKAFDEASISREDWEFIKQSVQQQMALQAAQINQLQTQTQTQQAQSAATQPAGGSPSLDEIAGGAAKVA